MAGPLKNPFYMTWSNAVHLADFGTDETGHRLLLTVAVCTLAASTNEARWPKLKRLVPHVITPHPADLSHGSARAMRGCRGRWVWPVWLGCLRP